MNIFIGIFLSTILSDNYVLSKFLGICPFLGVSKRLRTAMGMGISVAVVMVMATLATWPINHFLLEKHDLSYMCTLVFILVIAALVQMLETVLKKYIPSLYNALGIYLPLITTNCAVLGVTLLNIDEKYTFLQSLVSSFGAGIGFCLALVLFAGVRERLETADVPDFLKGLPITLISASLVSLSFMGFKGII